MEHGPALVALLYLPIAIMGLLIAADIGDRLNYRIAALLIARYRRSSESTRLAALLLAVSATIHLALAPAHSAEPVTAALFVADGLGLALAALMAVSGAPRWRTLASILLAASLSAYAIYLATGQETADLVGVATKIVESAGLVLIVIHPLSRCVLLTESISNQRRHS